MPRNPTTEDRTWFEFIAAAKDAPPEILINDYIGSYGVSAKDFDTELKALGKVQKVILRLNTPGGETPTAAAIWNMMERFKAANDAEVLVIIDGVAASCGSWLAMLGDEVVMPENTLMMIHDPSGGAWGTSKEMRTIATVLDKIKQSMVTAYVAKSGRSREEVEAIMEETTWYTAEEAVEAGFADRVDNPIEITATFDMSRYKNPPPVAWEGSGPLAANQGEADMANPPKPETPAEMEARLRAQITAEMAAAPAPVVPVVAAAAETPEAMATRIRSEMTAVNAEINDLCKLAGKAGMAADFIAQGKTPAEVRTALTAAVATPADTSAAGGGLNNHGQQAPQDDHSDLVVKAIDHNSVWKGYNAKATRWTKDNKAAAN
jgi:ATP-dependent Clp protease protease subunit